MTIVANVNIRMLMVVLMGNKIMRIVAMGMTTRMTMMIDMITASLNMLMMYDHV